MPADLGAWCAMRLALFQDESPAELEAEARSHFQGHGDLAVVLICRDAAGEALGMLELGLRSYAEGCTSSPVPYVEAWYVAAPARRRGIGRALMAAAEAWAHERGFTELASDALLDNHVSEHAHRAIGFAEVERAIHFRKAIARRSGPVS